MNYFFGDNIKYLLSNYTSKTEFAKALGVDRTLISKYISGTNPSIAVLIRISKLHKYSLDDLILKDLCKNQ